MSKFRFDSRREWDPDDVPSPRPVPVPEQYGNLHVLTDASGPFYEKVTNRQTALHGMQRDRSYYVDALKTHVYVTHEYDNGRVKAVS